MDEVKTIVCLVANVRRDRENAQKYREALADIGYKVKFKSFNDDGRWHILRVKNRSKSR